MDACIEQIYHEFTKAFVDLLVQILDEIGVSDAVDGLPESILLCQIGKNTGNVRE